jgi:hypothetical protein
VEVVRDFEMEAHVKRLARLDGAGVGQKREFGNRGAAFSLLFKSGRRLCAEQPREG